MRDDRFEWDDAKAWANLKKHEVSFEAARLVSTIEAASTRSKIAASTAKIASSPSAW